MPAGKCYLNSNEFLQTGQYLVSQNSVFFAVQQSDGNFCIYFGSGPGDNQGYIWGTQSSGTGPDFFTIQQTDGNFCIYRGTGPGDNQGYVWGTQVLDKPDSLYNAVLQDDGNFCIYRGAFPERVNGSIWETGSNCKTWVMDQESVDLYSYAGELDNWQTFTADRTGLMPSLDVACASGLHGSNQVGTIRYYAGEGINGTLLASDEHLFANIPSVPFPFQGFSVTTPFLVIAGFKYTFRLTVPTMNVTWISLGLQSGYPRGRSNRANRVLRFRTYVLVP